MLKPYLEQRRAQLVAERDQYQREAEARLLAYAAVIAELEAALDHAAAVDAQPAPEEAAPPYDEGD